VIRPQLVRAFTHAALSPDPDLAIAALMIAGRIWINSTRSDAKRSSASPPRPSSPAMRLPASIPIGTRACWP